MKCSNSTIFRADSPLQPEEDWCQTKSKKSWSVENTCNYNGGNTEASAKGVRWQCCPHFEQFCASNWGLAGGVLFIQEFLLVYDLNGSNMIDKE